MAYSAGSKHGGDRLIGKRVRTFMARTRTSGGSGRCEMIVCCAKLEREIRVLQPPVFEDFGDFVALSAREEGPTCGHGCCVCIAVLDRLSVLETGVEVPRGISDSRLIVSLRGHDCSHVPDGQVET